MKHLFLILLNNLTGAFLFAQTNQINGLVISASLEFESQSSGGSNMTQISTAPQAITIYYKTGMTKTILESSTAGKLTAYSNKDSAKSTRIVERRNGDLTGFEVQEDTSSNVIRNDKTTGLKTILYTEETKQINKFSCKKAVLIYGMPDGSEVSTDIWYTNEVVTGPDFRFPSVIAQGLLGLDKVKGFPIYFQYTRANGQLTIVKVSKVRTEILDDSIFEIPKNIEIRAQNQAGVQGAGGQQFIQINKN